MEENIAKGVSNFPSILIKMLFIAVCVPDGENLSTPCCMTDVEGKSFQWGPRQHKTQHRFHYYPPYLQKDILHGVSF